MLRGFCTALVTIAILACGGSGKPPVRGVLETDIEAWGFRRYQAVLDPEVWVKGNKSRGYTASYVRKQAEKRGQLAEQDVVNAFVTRFRQARGVAPALVRFTRRLAQESGYLVDEESINGTRVIMVSGFGEKWAWWASKKHIVKVGGRGVEKIPESLVSAYAERYPSHLRAGVLEAEVEAEDEPELETEAYDPDNPKTEWQRRKEAPEGKRKKTKKRKKRKKKRSDRDDD